MNPLPGEAKEDMLKDMLRNIWPEKYLKEDLTKQKMKRDTSAWGRRGKGNGSSQSGEKRAEMKKWHRILKFFFKFREVGMGRMIELRNSVPEH